VGLRRLQDGLRQRSEVMPPGRPSHGHQRMATGPRTASQGERVAGPIATGLLAEDKTFRRDLGPCSEKIASAAAASPRP
jgi:hypothetical protein